MGLQNYVFDHIKVKQLILYGHVQRMGKQQMAQKSAREDTTRKEEDKKTKN